jgi:hypothetical protein
MKFVLLLTLIMLCNCPHIIPMDRSRICLSSFGSTGTEFLYLDALNLQAIVAKLPLVLLNCKPSAYNSMQRFTLKANTDNIRLPVTNYRSRYCTVQYSTFHDIWCNLRYILGFNTLLYFIIQWNRIFNRFIFQQQFDVASRRAEKYEPILRPQPQSTTHPQPVW